MNFLKRLMKANPIVVLLLSIGVYGISHGNMICCNICSFGLAILAISIIVNIFWRTDEDH